MIVRATEHMALGYFDPRCAFGSVGDHLPDVPPALREIAWACRAIPYCANGWVGPSEPVKYD